jgi:3-hydroxyacyl-CoA dehydrogenase/3a,7a,12a-trihydroxy-5b-cholest-24-enoyl-CoA hydratase
MAEITAIPSLRFNPMMLLHGEQELVLPTGGLPLSASITTKGRISNVYDKGSGAVVVFEAASTDNRSGALLAINR